MFYLYRARMIRDGLKKKTFFFVLFTFSDYAGSRESHRLRFCGKFNLFSVCLLGFQVCVPVHQLRLRSDTECKPSTTFNFGFFTSACEKR